MTQNEQKKFIRELIRNVQTEIIAKVPNMPAYWDGIELRQYIADKFAGVTMQTSLNTRARKLDYKNTIATTNL